MVFLSVEFKLINIFIILASFLCFGLPLLILKNVKKQYFVFCALYLMYSIGFFGFSIVSFIMDPGAGRYSSFANVEAEHVIISMFMYLLVSLILLSPFTLNVSKYKQYPISHNINKFGHIDTYFFISLGILLFSGYKYIFSASVLSLGGMQNYGIFSFQKVIALMDPMVPIAIYFFTKLQFNLEINKKDFILIILLLIVGALSGSKESALRVLYIFIPILLYSNPFHKINTRVIIFGGLTIIFVSLIFFLFGHFFRILFQTGSFEFFYDFETFFDFVLIRMGGLDEFFGILARNDIDYSEYFNLNYFFGSLVNFLLPGSMVDQLPMSNYFGYLYKGHTLSDISNYYTTYELSLPGAIYVLGNGFLGLIGISVVLATIIRISLDFINRHSGCVYILPVIYVTFPYIIRSLSLDDTIFLILKNIAFSLILVMLARQINKFRFKTVITH